MLGAKYRIGGRFWLHLNNSFNYNIHRQRGESHPQLTSPPLIVESHHDPWCDEYKYLYKVDFI